MPLKKALGPLTTLVNNAGVSVMNRGDLLEVSEASYDRCQSVNTKGTFFLTQTFAKRLLERDASGSTASLHRDGHIGQCRRRLDQSRRILRVQGGRFDGVQAVRGTARQ